MEARAGIEYMRALIARRRGEQERRHDYITESDGVGGGSPWYVGLRWKTAWFAWFIHRQHETEIPTKYEVETEVLTD